jgi:hypothetical protein
MAGGVGDDAMMVVGGIEDGTGEHNLIEGKRRGSDGARNA